MFQLSDEEVSQSLRDHARNLLGFILMLVGDREVADDLFQETCLEGWRHRRRYRAGQDFGAWIRGVARNCVLRHRRQAARHRERVTPFDEGLHDHLDAAWSSKVSDNMVDVRRKALQDCLQSLGRDQRGLLARRYNDHESHALIASSVGKSEDAVKMTLSRLRKKLSDCMSRKLQTGGEHV